MLTVSPRHLAVLRGNMQKRILFFLGTFFPGFEVAVSGPCLLGTSFPGAKVTCESSRVSVCAPV